MSTAVQADERMKAEAVAAADPLVQEVYAAQVRREEAGEPPFEPNRMLRVHFDPKPDGRGYVAELRPVVVGDAEKAQQELADLWLPDRGWVYRGRKAASDPDAIRRPRAAAVPGDDVPSGQPAPPAEE